MTDGVKPKVAQWDERQLGVAEISARTLVEGVSVLCHRVEGRCSVSSDSRIQRGIRRRMLASPSEANDRCRRPICVAPTDAMLGLLLVEENVVR